MNTLEVVRNLEKQLDDAKREVGRELLVLRTSRELTLKDVAKRVKISPATIHNIEQAKHFSITKAQKIARFLTAA